MSNWRNRIVGYGEEDPRTLVANPLNFRRHPDRQRAATVGSLAEVGWVDTVTVNRTSGRVVDGHLRIEEALRAGEASVPVTYVELSEDEERLVLSELNSPLSAREMEIARLVAMGATNREIAHSLGISSQTVKNHLGSIYRKTGAAGRYDLGVIAVGGGWVDLDLCYQYAEARAARNLQADQPW